MDCQILNKLAAAPKCQRKRVLYTDGNTAYMRWRRGSCEFCQLVTARRPESKAVFVFCAIDPMKNVSAQHP